MRHGHQQELQEASKWDQGAKKDKNADKEAKRQEQLARKAEAARLLAEEEANTLVKKSTPNKTGNKKKGAKPAGPGALPAEGGLDSVTVDETNDEPKQPESYSATGIDNALDLLEVVNAKTDKASVGQQAAGIERHPEVSVSISRNFFEAYLCVYPSSQRRFKVREPVYAPRLSDILRDMLMRLGSLTRPPWRRTRNESCLDSGSRYFSDSTLHRWLWLKSSD